MHADPALFPDPSSFGPERFLEGAGGPNLHLDPVRRRAAALPWGGVRWLRDAHHATDHPATHHPAADQAADERTRGHTSRSCQRGEHRSYEKLERMVELDQIESNASLVEGQQPACRDESLVSAS